MTWGARMNTDKGQDCMKCTEGKHCYISKIRYSIASLVTNVDTMPTGKMASGTLIFDCNGFTPKEEQQA